MFHSYRPLLGACFIIVGVFVLIFTIGQLIFRILMALFALSLINIGLQLYHLPSVYVFLNRWFFRRF